jgi:glycosyltransferase involved in cell wall biosynthesis
LLFVTGWLWPWSLGGPSNVLKNLIDRLALNPNFEITVCATIPWSERKNVHIHYDNNIRFLLAPTFWGVDSFFDTLFAQIIYSIKILRDKECYNLVHFNILPGLRARLVPVVIRRFKRSKPAFILNFHDIPGIEAHAMSESKLKTLGTLVHWGVARPVLSTFDAVVINSTFMRNIIQEEGLFKTCLHVIPNGINLEENTLYKHASNLNESLNLLCVGAFFPKKAQDVLIKAFSQTRAKNFSHLYFVGRDTYFRKHCKKLSERLNVSERVSFIDPLEREDFLKLMSSADVYIQPSLWEGFGIAILEAMACGKPVIVTRVGGPIDFIVDGKSGLLIDPNDVNSLAHAIDRLAFNNELRQAISKNARKIGEKYDWASIIPIYEGLYEDLLFPHPIVKLRE